jgi:hypothetical protein
VLFKIEPGDFDEDGTEKVVFKDARVERVDQRADVFVGEDVVLFLREHNIGSYREKGMVFGVPADG